MLPLLPETAADWLVAPFLAVPMVTHPTGLFHLPLPQLALALVFAVALGQAARHSRARTADGAG